ncbi:hypothetical protein HZH68_008868 [Vespula germanica]|uniref:DUF4485 domain-containing protein n=1 Tax=Vespula germanica TaxID=30212 RepID=A0A834K1W8_VESGE|nr:hypothetical protein HZH68_008868 [Vespula germanica]
MEDKSLRDASIMYDKQFNENMKIAKYFLKQLHDKQEVQLATKWLSRVNDIKSSSLEVKRDRNAFLCYLLKVLREAILKHRCEHKSSTILNSENTLNLCYIANQDSKLSMKGLSTCAPQTSNIPYHSKWSKNHRTYVAVKPLPGRGALIYMAVSKRPGLENWDLVSMKLYLWYHNNALVRDALSVI